MNTETKQQAIVHYFMVRNAGVFIDFVRKVFDAKLVAKHTREASEDVIHAELDIAGQLIFVADSGQCGGVWISPSSPEGSCSKNDGGKPIQMFAYVESWTKRTGKCSRPGDQASWNRTMTTEEGCAESAILLKISGG